MATRRTCTLGRVWTITEAGSSFLHPHGRGSTGRGPRIRYRADSRIRRVDDKGEKMSKSVGNTISAVKATEQYGADILRLYVASMDYADDVRDRWRRGIKEMSEAYRKIRTDVSLPPGQPRGLRRIRPRARSTLDKLHEIDLWTLGRLNDVIRDVRAAYTRNSSSTGFTSGSIALFGGAFQLLPRCPERPLSYAEPSSMSRSPAASVRPGQIA